MPVITLFLAGDVMIGRGIDRVLPQSVDPVLFEPHVKSAETYVELAERAGRPIPRPVTPAYPWGDALLEMERTAPDVRLINLETAVTTSDAASPGKEVLYRTHPGNVTALTAAGIQCCALANNHVLDWGRAGLLETLDSLRAAGVATVGAGRDRSEARSPAIIGVRDGRVIILGLASTNSGVPAGWRATADRPGVELIDGWAAGIAEELANRPEPVRRAGDVVVVSVHWGSNWGFGIPDGQRRLAHRLIDVAGVDVVHGHSSHHPRPIEVYGGRLILYGCGDFITDYEGIGGHEEFRNDLILAYFPSLDPGGELRHLRVVPFRLQRFRLTRPSLADARWLCESLDRHSRPFGTRVDLAADGTFEVSPAPGQGRFNLRARRRWP